MRQLNFITLGMALTLCAAACSDATSEESLPPDVESELETLNGKADGTGITPGSSQAETLLRFVNQPIADDQAGQAFVDLLDSKLHAWPARNIGEFRAGPDGRYGTGDDQTFNELETLDAVPWVGPVALQQLYLLAEEEGYGTPSPSLCSEFIEKTYGQFRLQSFADLVEVEASGCTIFDDDVNVSLGRGVFPTDAKRLEQLGNITEIRGGLYITADTSVLDGVSLPNLKRVSRGLSIRERDDGEYGALEVDLSGLVETPRLTLVGVSEVQVGVLESANNVEVTFHDSGILNLPSLPEVKTISLKTKVAGAGVTIDAPQITELDLFEVEATGALETVLPSLQRVGDLTLRGTHLAAAEFEALTEITGSALMFGTTDPLVGLTALETIGGNFRIENSSFENVEGHVGPGNLTSIGGRLWVDQDPRYGRYSISGYESLDSVERITIRVDCDTIDGFNALESLESLVILARDNCSIGGFSNLEFIASHFRLVASSRSQDPTGFDSLVAIGGDFEFTGTRVGETLEALEIIGGDFTYLSADGFSGFNALTTVDGELSLKTVGGRNASDRILGLNELIGIGADFVISVGVADEQIQRVVDQLQVLGGNVRRY